MKRILVAVNFSDHSPGLIRYALKLAQYFKVELGFVHVISYKSDGQQKVDKVDENKSGSIHEILDKYISRIYAKQFHDIIVETYIRKGKPSKEIAELATSINADLVIVSKEYPHKITFFDDTADMLISLSPCPIMTIPSGTEFHRIERIIYASAFLLEDCAAILELQKWVEKFNGEIICIHAAEDKHALEKAKNKMEVLKRLFPQDNIIFRCFIADIRKGIDRYAQLSKADVLCTMHKNRNMLQSIFSPSKSKKLSDRANQPVVIFNQNLLSPN
ncbi:MAG: universal stress protein [Saprospiraceae bacterium]|nr:universal stress protein [Saprospiraceae bacterium]